MTKKRNHEHRTPARGGQLGKVEWWSNLFIIDQSHYLLWVM